MNNIENGHRVFLELSKGFETIKRVISEQTGQSLSISNIELLGAYMGTEFMILTDKSEGFKDSWNFLQRRLEGIKHFDSSMIQVTPKNHSVLSPKLALFESFLHFHYSSSTVR
jgi:COQ9